MVGEPGLTPGQLRHFRAFGYVTVPALLTAPELATAAREFDAGRSDPQIQSLAATPAGHLLRRPVIFSPKRSLACEDAGCLDRRRR